MKHQLELPLFEEWKTVSGYENYQVSNFGRVKSLNYRHTNQEQILKLNTNNNGYQQVQLWKDGKVKMFRVNRLVAMAFIPNPNNYAEVNHIDECKTNNHVSNLEWCDRKYNCNYGIRNERISKQVIQLTLDNEVIKIWGSTRDVERTLGYNHSNISLCCSGKQRTSNGYKWQYA